VREVRRGNNASGEDGKICENYTGMMRSFLKAKKIQPFDLKN